MTCACAAPSPWRIDRQGLIDNVTKGGQKPAQWFARPGLAGAPTIEDHPDLGVKSDVEAAKKELQSYLDEKNLTVDKLDITLMFNTSAGHQKIAEAIQQMWKDNLGLDVKVVNQEWKVYLVTTKDPRAPRRSSAWAGAWTTRMRTTGDQGCCRIRWLPEPERGRRLQLEERCVREAGRRRGCELDPKKRTGHVRPGRGNPGQHDAVMAPIYWYTNLAPDQAERHPHLQRSSGHEALEKWDIAPAQ